MKPARIIYVPGKNLKPPTDAYSYQLSRCLAHSVGRINPQLAAQIKVGNMLTVVDWNHIFYQAYADIVPDLPWIDRLLSQTNASDDDRKHGGGFSVRVTRLLYHIGDYFPKLIDWFADERIRTMLAGTKRYFNNEDGIAERVRAVLIDALQASWQREESICLISHSMGSIIAFDALTALRQSGDVSGEIDLFVTMGSPLGLRYTQQRLLCRENMPVMYPDQIKHWKNISACGDLVSVDKTLANDFKAMQDHHLLETIEDYTDGVYNWFKNESGYNPHRSYGYMVNPITAQIISNWWQKR